MEEQEQMNRSSQQREVTRAEQLQKGGHFLALYVEISPKRPKRVDPLFTLTLVVLRVWETKVIQARIGKEKQFKHSDSSLGPIMAHMAHIQCSLRLCSIISGLVYANTVEGRLRRMFSSRVR